MSVDPQEFLRQLFATAFAALDVLVVTEPTRTNVDDLRAILIFDSASQGRTAHDA
ncbi:hypothetical protein [Pseudomonas asplenii]|uniref:hypothetical protein n=1 Tax=Pseudomonas asplenii TaxID=53407 RepID=UPI002361C1A5|nr:hypothetical protein [Pseudomonas asplenii]